MKIERRLGGLDKAHLKDNPSQEVVDYHRSEAATMASNILRRCGSAQFAALVAKELGELALAAIDKEKPAESKPTEGQLRDSFGRFYDGGE